MPKPREGYHDLVTQIPDVLWDRLDKDAAEKGHSLVSVLVGILQKHYKISADSLPPRRRLGRPAKKSPPS